MYDAARLNDRHRRYLRMRAEPAELAKQAQQADACWTTMLEASSGRTQQYVNALALPLEFTAPDLVCILSSFSGLGLRCCYCCAIRLVP